MHITFILTGEARKYLLTCTEHSQRVTTVCEILQFSEKPRSWFVGETVQKGQCLMHASSSIVMVIIFILGILLIYLSSSTDGSLYICTPIDPVFLVLPYLVKSAKVCICKCM